MGIDNADTIKDNELQIYVDGINKEVNGKIGRNILANDYVEKYRGTDTTDLILDNRPINSVVAVEFIQDGQIYGSLESYEYDVENESGILICDRGWELTGYSSYMSGNIDYPRKHIRVTYNAGFKDVPSDIKLICLQHASDTYNLDNSQASTLKSYGISDIKIEFKSEINYTEKQLDTLRSYRGVMIG
jgi:hypothetical protein